MLDLTLSWIELVSLVLGIAGWVVLTVGMRLIAQIVERHSIQFKALSRVFNSLFAMCALFIFTRAFSPLTPDYVQLFRIISLLPVFGVAFEVVRFLAGWYRVKRTAPAPDALRETQ